MAVVISEAKYIDVSSLSAKRKESQKQLRDTVKRVNEALFGSPARLDRDLWLARLSDLILDGIQFPVSARIDLADWRRAVREGECEIYVRGYSHVFISGPSDAVDYSSFTTITDLDNSYQEVFGRAKVREIVLKYFHDEDPIQVREDIDVEKERVWKKQNYRRPTERETFKLADEPRKEDAGGPPPPQRIKDALGSTNMPTFGKASAGHLHPTSWTYPSIASLIGRSGAEIENLKDEEWLKQVQSRTRSALQQFQLQAKLLNAFLAPNCALLKFAGSPNLTVEQVLKHRSEFLTTHGLNIISVQPEAGIVSLSIERPVRRIITIQELWARWMPDSEGGNQELLIGVREDDGNLLFLSPGKQHAPHTLIAGSTGSGKSVLMQNVVLCIAATNTPKQAKVILIDPKRGVDYYQFDGLPHIEGGLIDDEERALERLRALVSEMDERYLKLRANRVPSLTAYNQRVPQHQRLPVIWVIHDEFAEWMLVEDYKEEVTSIVSRLGVKARAAGIYLVFAAQRPDANVMPMQLRANLGNRLILRVDSEGTSEIALGDRGAERLLGRGHLLAKLEGAPGLCYAQVPFVETKFMEQVVLEIRQREASR